MILPRIALQTIRAGGKDEPRYKLIFYATSIFAALVLSFSMLLIGEQKSQNDAQLQALHSLDDEAAALRGSLSDLSRAAPAAQADENIPHPTVSDRDAQFIGTHADVSWSAVSGSKFANAQYEINLVRLESDSEESSPAPIDTLPEPFFLASDSAHLTSRLPSSPEQELPPGKYVWRVAQVSQGYDPKSSTDPEIGMLSSWSNYGYFTIYKTIEDRITATRRIRVGVDLSQNSPFTYAERGTIAGSDVVRIRQIVENCLAVSNVRLSIDAQRCSSSGSLGQGSSAAACLHDQTRVCVEFVPIERWGEWRSALSRKEIDLFVGGVTAAEAREGDGIRFLSSYREFETRVYVNKADLADADTSLSRWLVHRRVVGVIENSSNDILMGKLLLRYCPSRRVLSGETCKLDRKPFSSFPSMDQAMDRGEIDGVLIDETFVDRNEWQPLRSLRSSDPTPWKAYEQSFLGYQGSEKLAFPIAVDSVPAERRPLWQFLELALSIRNGNVSAVASGCHRNCGVAQ